MKNEVTHIHTHTHPEDVVEQCVSLKIHLNGLLVIYMAL